jgi:hypothetical protein
VDVMQALLLQKHDARRRLLPSLRKSGRRMSPNPISVFAKIMVELRLRYRLLNLHYEAAWTDSWTHRRCLHKHQTPIEAARCAMPHGAGCYVFAVEGGTPRELNAGEEAMVNNFRFGTTPITSTPEIGTRT